MFSTRLKHIHEAQTPNIGINTPRQRTKHCCPTVIYDMHDYMHTLIVDCKYTLVGKFSTTMLKVELVRKRFTQQTELIRGVNTAHYNSRHLFIDIQNDLNYHIICIKQ